jgi:hypothetical protein
MPCGQSAALSPSPTGSTPQAPTPPAASPAQPRWPAARITTFVLGRPLQTGAPPPVRRRPSGARGCRAEPNVHRAAPTPTAAVAALSGAPLNASPARLLLLSPWAGEHGPGYRPRRPLLCTSRRPRAAVGSTHPLAAPLQPLCGCSTAAPPHLQAAQGSAVASGPSWQVRQCSPVAPHPSGPSNGRASASRRSNGHTLVRPPSPAALAAMGALSVFM